MDIPKEISYKIIKYACDDDHNLIRIMMVDKYLHEYVQKLFYNFLRQMSTYSIDVISVRESYAYGLNCLLTGRIRSSIVECKHNCLPLSIQMVAATMSTEFVWRPLMPTYEIDDIVINVGHKSIYFRRNIDNKYMWNSNINKRDKPYVLGFLHEYFREIYDIIIWTY